MPSPKEKAALGLKKGLQALTEARLYLWVFSAGRVFLSTLVIS